MNWLWAETPPDPLLTFAEIAGLPPEVLAQLQAFQAQAASEAQPASPANVYPVHQTG